MTLDKTAYMNCLIPEDTEKSDAAPIDMMIRIVAMYGCTPKAING